MSEKPSGRRPNTLGIRGTDLESVVRRLEGSDGGRGHVRRRHARMPFVRESVHVRLQQPGAAPQILKLACRNLSSGGISLLHNAFVHPGSPCAIVLEHRVTGPCVIEGEVVRCTHRAGVLHEIGVRFHEPILVADYLKGVGHEDLLSFEHVDPHELEGEILLVEANATDEALFRHYLSETRLRVRWARSFEEASEQLEKQPDIIALDLHMEHDTGPMFLVRRRAAGDRTPVIAMSVETDSDGKSLLATLAHVRMLKKPLDQGVLLRSIAEFLLQDLPAETGVGSIDMIGANLPRQLLEAFRTELDAAIRELEASLQDQDTHRCRHACQRLVSSAPSLGLQSLGDMSRDTLARLGEDGMEAVTEQIHALLDTCRHHLAA